MARGDRPHSTARRLLGAIRARGAALLFAGLALAVLTPYFALSPAQPASAQETQWVLTQTLVNPENVPLEYHGGGETPGFFGEERFKDMFLIYQVSATNFTVKDHWQDREYVAWDVTITCDFDAPEAVLAPGESYKLTARFSHGGTANEPSPGARFAYEGPDVGLQNTDTLAYYPWTADFKGVDSKTWTFTAPKASPGATMTIQAGLWNAAACTVIWKYEARTAASDARTTTTTGPTTTASLSVTDEVDATTRTFTDEEFEKMLADTAGFAKTYGRDLRQRELLKDGYIGLLISYGGDFSVYDRTGRELPWGEGGITGRGESYMQPIRIGDTVRTGGTGSGAVWIFTRYKDEEDIVKIGNDTEVVFTKFGTTDQEVSSTVLEMLKGVIRYLGNRFRAGSIFSVRAGTTLAGMRGTDVVIAYGGENQLVGAWVHQGPVDFTSSRTGETKTLTDGEALVVQDGTLGPVRPLTGDQWDKILIDSKLTGDVELPGVAAVEQPDEPGGRPIVLVGPEDDLATDATVVGSGVASGSNLTLILAVVIPVVVVVAVAIGIGIYLLRRRKRAGGAAAPSIDAPVGGDVFAPAHNPPQPEAPGQAEAPPKADASAPGPGFCRNCGSPIQSRTLFCGQCGEKL